MMFALVDTFRTVMFAKVVALMFEVVTEFEMYALPVTCKFALGFSV